MTRAFAAIWDFVAGGSRVIPLGVAFALLATLAVLRFGAPAAVPQLLLFAAVATTLALASYEPA